MSRNVIMKVRVANGSRGRKRLERAPDGPLNPKPPPPERVPRVARLLALAHHWRGLIRDGTVRDQADLARLVGVSRARVSQVMRLLDLAPDIQEAVLDGKVDAPGAELRLRKVAEEPSWKNQRADLAHASRPTGVQSRADCALHQGVPSRHPGTTRRTHP